MRILSKKLARVEQLSLVWSHFEYKCSLFDINTLFWFYNILTTVADYSLNDSHFSIQ